ncbi:MAG: hypothetical protein U0797_16745 [Gemmataceae bacterium]
MRHKGPTAAVIAVLAALTVGNLVDARPPENEDDVPTQLKMLREELDTLRKRVELDRQVTRDKLADIDAKLDRITGMLGNGTRTARSIDPAPLRTGTIRLDNRLGVEARVSIDGTAYTVAPLSVRVLRNQPAGPFVYDLTADGFGASAARQRRLGPNETWTLTIY